MQWYLPPGDRPERARQTANRHSRPPTPPTCPGCHRPTSAPPNTTRSATTVRATPNCSPPQAFPSSCTTSRPWCTGTSASRWWSPPRPRPPTAGWRRCRPRCIGERGDEDSARLRHRHRRRRFLRHRHRDQTRQGGTAVTTWSSRPARDPAAPGTGTRIPVSPLTFRRSPTSSRSRRARTGRAPTRRARELKAYAEHCVDKYGAATEDPVQHQGARRGFRRGRQPVARRPRHRRRGHRPVPGQRQRRADHAQPARHRRRRLLRRRDHAHRAVGPRAGSDGQARRDHRHRRLRGAGHPRDRADCRAAHRFSAHTDLVLPQARRAAVAAWRGG